MFLRSVSLTRMCMSGHGCESTCVCPLWKCIQVCHTCARVEPGVYVNMCICARATCPL